MPSILPKDLSRLSYYYGLTSLAVCIFNIAEAVVTVPSIVLSSPVGITVTKPEVYDTFTAPFGLQFESEKSHHTEIMLPVVEKGSLVSSRNFMCSDDEFWIDFLANTTATASTANETAVTKAKGSLRKRQFLQNSPLRNGKSKALLVPKGRCPIDEKIKMIMKINEYIKKQSDLEQQEKDASKDVGGGGEKQSFQSNWNNKKKGGKSLDDEPAIKYVLIYDNTTSSKSTLTQEIQKTAAKLALEFPPSNSSTTSNSTNEDETHSDGINVHVMFMKYYDGYMLNQLLYTYHWDQVKRNFGKQNFDLPIGSIGISALVDSKHLYDSPNSHSGQGWGIGTIAASWLRFVVCILLLLFPLIRTLVLWYSAGGRIRIRSEENGSGRIGIYYVRPHPNWLSGFRNGDMNTGTGMFGNDTTTQDSLLTKEEVLAFPEVSYDPERINISCCSICLDEYEEGENVRLLPCGHAFHTDCIHPWLTERQACCPLCKVSVRTVEGENEDGNTETSLPEETTHSTGS